MRGDDAKPASGLWETAAPTRGTRRARRSRCGRVWETSWAQKRPAELEAAELESGRKGRQTSQRSCGHGLGWMSNDCANLGNIHPTQGYYPPTATHLDGEDDDDGDGEDGETAATRSHRYSPHRLPSAQKEATTERRSADRQSATSGSLPGPSSSRALRFTSSAAI